MVAAVHRSGIRIERYAHAELLAPLELISRAHKWILIDERNGIDRHRAFSSIFCSQTMKFNVPTAEILVK